MATDAPLAAVLLGILQQVREHDVERRAIDARRQGRRHLRHRHALTLAPRLARHLVARLGKIAVLVAARRKRVGPGELEDAPHQALQPLGVGQDIGQELAPLLGRHLVEMVAQKLGASAEAGELRLELVADAECQVALMTDAAASPPPNAASRGTHVFRLFRDYLAEHGLVGRALMLAVLTLLLRIPLGMVDSVIADRQSYQSDAIDNVRNSWAARKPLSDR
jgi:inner membrane protein CreD